MYYKRKTNCKDSKSCLNPSKIENKINILKDDNYNDDKWLKNIVNFWKKKKYCKNHEEDLKVIDMIHHL